jgi:broad specificity phosphatase PhoE
MTLEIKIIRHAESEANVGDFFDNPATIRITNLGQKQAEALVSQLGKSEIVLFSNLIELIKQLFLI